MKLLTFFILFLSCLLTACSVSNDEVSIEGRILHMNQAEFYLYSTDGVIDGIDTIHVQGGRFEYLKPINNDGTLVIVFPNYSQIPLFVKGGMSIDIQGEASKLKELEISGGSDNETFSEWRANNVDGSIEQQKVSATKFISDNPESPISLWLLRQYYVTAQKPDIHGAITLLDQLLKESPDNLAMKKMHTQLMSVGFSSVGDRVGHFSATDINGANVNEGMLQSGTTVIMSFATWNYESQNMLRILAGKLRGNSSSAFFPPGKGPSATGSIDRVIAVSLDADVNECRRTVKNCIAENVTVICDGRQFDSPLLMLLHLTTIPSNIVVTNGKVTKLDERF